MNRKLLTTSAIAAAILWAGSAQLANAAMQIKLTTGGGITQTITDNGAGDTNPAVGQIGFAGSVGVFSTVITSNVSNSPGADDGAWLQGNTISIRDTSNQKANLTISVTDTDFTRPDGPNLTLGSSFAGTFLSGAAGETATLQSYLGSGNGAFGTTFTTGVQSLTLPSGSALPYGTSAADKNTAVNNIKAPYSLTQVYTLSLSAGGQANLAGTTKVISAGGAVPEPASLSLLGLGAALLVARRRRTA